MTFLRRLFGKKKRDPAQALLNDAIQANENFEYSSQETKSSTRSDLLALQKLDAAGKALGEGDLRAAVGLFEEAASLTSKEEDRRQFLEQAENLREHL